MGFYGDMHAQVGAWHLNNHTIGAAHANTCMGGFVLKEDHGSN
jgi:hypothetical protein